MDKKQQEIADAELDLAQLSQDEVEEAASEVEREWNVRVRCFPRWITEGRINKIDAGDRLRRQEAALKILQKVLAMVNARAVS